MMFFLFEIEIVKPTDESNRMHSLNIALIDFKMAKKEPN